LTLEKYPNAIIYIVNNPVIEEDSDNLRFLRDCERWLGVDIESAINSKFPDCSATVVWQTERYMSGIHGAPCTRALKKRARQQWEQFTEVDYHVLGFTYDEQKRYDRFILTERSNVLPILIDAKLTKQDCVDIISAAGLELPRMYSLGYPNANCIGCVKATSPTYWNLVRATHPGEFNARARLSRQLGVRLVRVNGQRIFLDELSPYAKGMPLKSMQIDCGIFCEEAEQLELI